ncbi:MAG: GatB/YqeY domain-containing protein [Legionellales bacterium]|jgi:uncharacterized protein|nr:GatB/YqeY domain-containing protein [Legionellales bacterium]
MALPIYELVLADVKTAMKNREKEKLESLRLIANEIKMYTINNKVDLPPVDKISINILTKMVKQRNDSISQFEKASREDLAVKERFQLDIIKSYLPEQLSEQQTKKIVVDLIKSKSISSNKQLGILMAEIKKMPAGTIDMGLVSKVAKELLQ